jgi:hypothetical protein
MLYERADHDTILEIIVRQHPEIKPRDLARWKETGYAAWLQKHERQQAMRSFGEFVVHAHEERKLADRLVCLGAARVSDALTDVDLPAWKEFLANKPDNYTDLIKCLVALSKQAFDLEKYGAEQIEADPEGGLSDETINHIERELHLFPSSL